MARDPVLIICKPTQVRRPDGKVITLMPGLKTDAVSDRIKCALPKEKIALLKARGRIVEERPPW